MSNVLTVRMRLGMFNPPQGVPYHSIPESVICSPEHQALARKMADEEIVLLKNQIVDGKPALPLDLHTVKRLALVGPNADILNLGDYSGSPLKEQSYTALQGLKERCDQAGIVLDYFPTASGANSVVPSDHLNTKSADGKGATQGLTGDYYATATMNPKKDKPTATRIDSFLNFDWSHIQPDPLAQGKEFGVVWNGNVHCDVPGRYTFAVTSDGAVKLSVNGVVGFDSKLTTDSKRQTLGYTVYVSQPGDVPISITYRHSGGDTGFVLKWSPPQQQDSYFAELKKDDAVIAVMGLTQSDEIEGHDRTTLHLPAAQEDFIRHLATVNPHTIVVTESGSSLALAPVADQVPALLQMFYGGQEQGRALGDVLFGDYNPAGRLPLTFYADDSQLRPMTEYDLTKGRTYMYLHEKPTYAFGYGLSYTTFTYGNLKLSTTQAKVGEPLTASVDVSNTGDRDGDEVVQGYVTAEKASVTMPIRQLWAFQRVHIPHGQTRTVTLAFNSSNFGHWDTARQNFVVEPGTFDIQVGAASDDIRATAPIQLNH